MPFLVHADLLLRRPFSNLLPVFDRMRRRRAALMALASNHQPAASYLPRFGDEKGWKRRTVIIHVSLIDLRRARDD